MPIIPDNVYEPFDRAGKTGDISLFEEACSKHLKKYPEVIGSALRNAAECHHGALVEFIVQGYSAHLNKDSIRSALTSCLFAKKSEMAVALVKGCRADWNEPLDFWGSTAMTFSAAQGLDEVVKCLLETNASIDGIPVSPKSSAAVACDTALMAAVSKNRKSTVELLLRHGANVNAMGRGGKTALDRAGRSAIRQAIRDLLVQHGAKTGKELAAKGDKGDPKMGKRRAESVAIAAPTNPKEMLESACHSNAGEHPRVKGAYFVQLDVKSSRIGVSRLKTKLDTIRQKLGPKISESGNRIVRTRVDELGLGLCLLPASDKYAVIRKLGFNGRKSGYSRKEIINFLKEIDEFGEFELVECSQESIDLKVPGKLRAPKKVAKMVAQFCPFSLENVGPEADLKTFASHIEAGEEFSIYWE